VFIVTAKVPRRRAALGAAAAALLCCCAAALQLTPEADRAVSASAVPDPKGIKTQQDQVDYLSAYGWQVDPEPLATQELQIPKEMDDSYDEYLSLQESQGFDLKKLAGKRVKRYTYEILNYPTGEEGVQAQLLIYKHKVVGGEVMSPRLDGFLHGLAMP